MARRAVQLASRASACRRAVDRARPFTSQWLSVCLPWLRVSAGLAELAGVGAVPAMLIYEHSLVKANDLSRVNAAFFTVNGYVSVLFLLFWAADIYFLSRGSLL